MFDRRNASRFARFALVAASVAIPATMRAQGPVSGNGFMFGRPNGSFTFRMGAAQPTANSDVYDFTHKFLTVGRGDYTAFNIAADIVERLSNQLSVQLNVGASGRTINSNFRDYVDNNDQEILQSTELRRVPITAGLRLYLAPTGRQLGQLAWVPSKVVPYVSAGGGAMWYRFRQKGDFVDFQNLDVFNTELTSTGWTPSAYGAVGAEISTSALVAITTEARYDIARSKMGGDFKNFHNIDLSGVSATVGLTFRF